MAIYFNSLCKHGHTSLYDRPIPLFYVLGLNVCHSVQIFSFLILPSGDGWSRCRDELLQPYALTAFDFLNFYDLPTLADLLFTEDEAMNA